MRLSLIGMEFGKLFVSLSSDCKTLVHTIGSAAFVHRILLRNSLLNPPNHPGV
jgi:hypothetical protein